ncbi:hypothetical protein ACRALDRAFT_1064539 [Sodiomyces alcalophilus JCM 7366]|uniref:uncharacterized protein n=1 Tax=Sodiomyces alcalophilus JCM 7366 TaxID=591952 RepID=UPI0039B5F9F1
MDKNNSKDKAKSKPAGQQDPKRTKTEADKPPTKKRRKVSHACVYCRRSHMTCDLDRPCKRCIKRNIGHLCRDEPRQPGAKKGRNRQSSTADASDSRSEAERSSIDRTGSMGPPPLVDTRLDQSAATGAKPVSFGRDLLGQGSPLQLVSPTPVTGMQGNGMRSGVNMNQFAGFSDAWWTAQNHFQDMQNFNPSYMIAPEVTNEFNLLNDFLRTNLLDDSNILGDEPQTNPTFNTSGQGLQNMLPGFPGAAGNLLQHHQTQQQQQQQQHQPEPQQHHQQLHQHQHQHQHRYQQQHQQQHPSQHHQSQGQHQQSQPPQSRAMLPPPNIEKGKAVMQPGSVVQSDKDKAREYYLQAADPSGNDTPEERMQHVLKAKYEAGLLKPFNYVNGYVRLGKYLDSHIAAESKHKILRTIDRFRPKFREKAQTLTDMELLYVEMWFEKQLMEYDRVFASMAVPACCWRRTGEIFRGNKEMAELIGVPVENLRDGRISLHEILTEESLVRYWEEFGTIAFDPTHDTLLTACTLKKPNDKATDPGVRCCLSFMIRRDDHKLPTLIVGNFLPNDVVKT